MGGKRPFLGLLALTALVQSAVLAIEPAEKPKFKDAIIKISGKLNVPIDIKLRTLLVNPQVPGPITWRIKSAPGWLQIDTAGERIFGTPTQAGTFPFKMDALVDEGGDFDHPAEVSIIAPPQFSVDDVDLGLQNEGKPFSFDITTVVTNPAGGTLNCEATNRPDWMAINGCVLSGTPKRDDVGKYQGIQLKVTGIGGSDTAIAHGEVLITPIDPKWKANEITLPNGLEDTPYTQIVAGFVDNPDAALGTPLKFQIVSQTPPPWLQLDESSGQLFGTPKAKNVKPISVAIRFTTTILGQPKEDTATFKFEVIHKNHAPEWINDVIDGPQALTKVPYELDLSGSAKDQDIPDFNDKLNFTIVSFAGPGPAWATLNPDTGKLTGTPDKANVGLNSWVIRVNDKEGLSDVMTLRIDVKKSNEPPFWHNKPTVLPDAQEDVDYIVSLGKYATDPDGDALHFTKISGPNWIQITDSGAIMVTPTADDVGTHRFPVRVSDGNPGHNDVTDVVVIVHHTNHAPEWILKPVVFNVKEEESLKNADISRWTKDKDTAKFGDTLKFTVLEGPTWATLSEKGVFTGTPLRPNVGENRYRVLVSDNHGATAEGLVIFNVQKVNKKPFWKPPVVLTPNAPEDAVYSNTVAPFAEDPDGDVLTYTKVSGPSWISVNPDGSVTGTPRREHVGVNQFDVQVVDPSGEFAVTTVKVTVDKVNKAPRWRQDPILLTPNAKEHTTYTFNLNPYIVEPDGDPYRCKLISYTGPGQAWTFVGDACELTGVPMTTNVGKFTLVLEVCDDANACAQTRATGEVEKVNHAPIINPFAPFQVKERQVLNVDLNQPQYISDPDGDKINCEMEPVVAWAKLTADCKLTASPKHAQIGLHSFRLKVDDGQIPVFGELKIQVLEDPQVPIWLQDPMNMVAKTNEPFGETLAGRAKDLDGRPITYSKVSGPAWLSVASSGAMSGTPRDSDLKVNEFTVQACNDRGLCAPAKLFIDVKPGTVTEEWQVDTKVPGAKAENLWVVDNSSHCDKTIKALKKHIGVYYNELTAAEIHHYGIYLSADAHKWDGLPIRPQNEPMLMKWSDQNLSAIFSRRTDLAYSGGSCGNCYNSPIWSMFRFYQRLPDLAEIYHNNYMMPGVPMDAMIVTHQRDHYKWYTKNNAEMKNWKPEDYAQSFLRTHENEKKSYRVSAIAPECPTLIDASGDPTAAAPENAYRVVVDNTGGKYYATNCDFDMVATLKDYAKRVIFRAYVHAKGRLKLTKTPIEINTIKVWLGTQSLPGNTGGPSDMWRYDGATNELILHWHLIDQGQIQPGAKIRIEYRVS